MSTLPSATTVPATDLSRNFGLWQDRAATAPVFVTHHGRTRSVLLSARDYARLGLPEPGDNRDSRLAMALDQALDGFIAIDAERRVTMVNPVAAAHLRATPTALVGRTLTEAAPGFADAILLAHLDRALGCGEAATLDLPSALYPGAVLRLRLCPYPGGVAAFFRNVADERRADDALAVEAARRQAMALLPGIGTGRLNLRGMLTEGSDGLAEMVGVATERLIGVRLTDLIALNARRALGEALDALLTGGEARRIATSLLVEGGKERESVIALAPIRSGVAVEGAFCTIMFSRIP